MDDGDTFGEGSLGMAGFSKEWCRGVQIPMAMPLYNGVVRGDELPVEGRVWPVDNWCGGGCFSQAVGESI